MNILSTKLPGLILLEPRVYSDARGFLMEAWNQAVYEKAGVPGRFVQDNVSFSTRHVLRGLHFQHPYGQGKFLQALEGEIYDVAVDIRVGSPTFGQWEGVALSAGNRRQFYIPAGFAHGFCVLSDSTLVAYKCTEYYHRETEGGILWDDPDLGIEWPVKAPVLSEKDRALPRLKEIPRERLPKYGTDG